MLRWLAVLALLAISVPAAAQPKVQDKYDKSPTNLMVVVRQSIGANRPQDSFKSIGTQMVRGNDGKEYRYDLAHYEFIGDLHIRFVFDGEQTMVNATPDDLVKLGLKSPEQALKLALANIKRVYGEPILEPWDAGVVQIDCKEPDLASAFFLDRDFWNIVTAKHPDGVVVAVPQRKGLLYAPAADRGAVAQLQRYLREFYVKGDRQRVSSALFLFKNGKWSVFQAPFDHG